MWGTGGGLTQEAWIPAKHAVGGGGAGDSGASSGQVAASADGRGRAALTWLAVRIETHPRLAPLACGVGHVCSLLWCLATVFLVFFVLRPHLAALVCPPPFQLPPPSRFIYKPPQLAMAPPLPLRLPPASRPPAHGPPPLRAAPPVTG